MILLDIHVNLPYILFFYSLYCSDSASAETMTASFTVQLKKRYFSTVCVIATVSFINENICEWTPKLTVNWNILACETGVTGPAIKYLIFQQINHVILSVPAPMTAALHSQWQSEAQGCSHTDLNQWLCTSALFTLPRSRGGVTLMFILLLSSDSGMPVSESWRAYINVEGVWKVSFRELYDYITRSITSYSWWEKCISRWRGCSGDLTGWFSLYRRKAKITKWVLSLYEGGMSIHALGSLWVKDVDIVLLPSTHVECL